MTEETENPKTEAAETDTPTEDKAAATPPERNLRAPVGKIIFAVGLLLGSWLIFGQVLPRVMGMYDRPNNSTAAKIKAEQTQTPAPATAPAAKFDDADPRQEIARLRTELDDLRVRLATLEEKANTTLPPADLEERLHALETRPGSITATGEASVDAGVLARLETAEKELSRLQELTQTSHSAEWRKVGMLTASQQLEARALSGKPFAAELESLRAFAVDNVLLADILDSIAPISIAGVASPNALKKNFEQAARTALSATEPDAGFTGKLKHSFAKIISIRKTGNQPGASDDAIIARAEAALEADDLAKASRELQSLSPAAAPAFEPWLGEVADILLLRTQLGELHNAVLREMRASQPEPLGAL